MSRFDYVKYDDLAQGKQTLLKLAAVNVEAAMLALDEAQTEFFGLFEEHLVDRPKDLAIESLQAACLSEDCYTQLEIAYMWCGKGIRDDQIERNGTAPLQEERGDE
jgi:hypothetical protein